MFYLSRLYLFISFILSQSTYALTIQGIVLRIHDGDTITIKSDELETNRKQKNVRMLGIDTPEIDFNDHGQGDVAIAARDFLRNLIPIGAQVTIDLGEHGNINSRRLLGVVSYQGHDINKIMLESGFAAPYFIYPFDKSLLKEYRVAAKEAFTLGHSVYQQGVQVPYEFRIMVQERIGTNYVGDLETKTLFLPEETHLVPYYRRIFIRSYDRALEIGYRFREDI